MTPKGMTLGLKGIMSARVLEESWC